jgi:hypothetical protein
MVRACAEIEQLIPARRIRKRRDDPDRDQVRGREDAR